jgi:hypothetical protein
MKRRMPKNPVKAKKARAKLDQQSRYKKQLGRWRKGASGRAGPVRHIDPKDYEQAP